MQKINDWENVEASKDFESLPIGGYVFKIVTVEDKVSNNGKPFLEIKCDVAEGEYKDFAKGNEKSLRKMRAYYEGNAKGLFKRFVENVENSNRGFKWDWDEQKLVGKVFGAVLDGREYLNQNGNKALATEITYTTTTTVDKIRKGDFRPAKIEELDPASVPAETSSTPYTYAEAPNENVPF